jgi:hypothetical protein
MYAMSPAIGTLPSNNTLTASCALPNSTAPTIATIAK